MKTLYININGENTQSTEDITVVGKPEDAIINKFYSELVRRIVEGMTVPRIGRSLVTDFEANNKEAFAKITEQWELVKQVLLGEDPTGTQTITLPEEYINWLKYHSNPVYNEIAKSLANRGNAVEISIEKIYRNAIGLLVNNIDLSKEYDWFAVNDNFVDDDSVVSADIRKKVGDLQLPFMSYMEWKALNNEVMDEKVDEISESKQKTDENRSQEQISAGYDKIRSFDCGHKLGEEKENDVENELHRFFPVMGEIILGETNFEDLMQGFQTAGCGTIYFYDAQGNKTNSFSKKGRTIIWFGHIKFENWKNHDVVSEVLILNTKPLFPKWKQLGFDWDLSYNEWMELFKKRGYKTRVLVEPHSDIDNAPAASERCLFAAFLAISPDASIRFTLDFAHGNGDKKHSKKTLYSIEAEIG